MLSSLRTFFFTSLALFLLSSTSTIACGQFLRPSVTLSSAQVEEIHTLATRVSHHLGDVDCKTNSCLVLVNNFSDSTGATSPLGIQLADELSIQLGKAATDIRVVNRDNLLQFIARERIPTHFLAEHNAARWLAMQMSANAVVVGEIGKEGTALHLTIRFLDARKLEKQSDDLAKREEKTREDANLDGLDTSPALAPLELLGESGKYPYGIEISDPKLEFYRVGQNGVTVPGCRRRDDPEVTNEARLAHASGSLVVEALITTDGRVTEPRIVRGLPFGLNDSALAVLKKWRCGPVLKEGVPVTGLVPIEMTFYLF
ncbi:MAG: energy transducer TonB [Acidobacteria bacterium]|nr:energy transducer TonB [Acidobacteriota bacterium]MBS1865934.1 energy transducer TonB [Acidobacteriota bacterium]